MKTSDKKEKLLAERYSLTKDMSDLKDSNKCLYFVHSSSTSFNSLKNSELYITSLLCTIEYRIKEIDEELGI